MSFTDHVTIVLEEIIIEVDCHRKFSHLHNCELPSLSLIRATSSQACAGIFCGEYSNEI